MAGTILLPLYEKICEFVIIIYNIIKRISKSIIDMKRWECSCLFFFLLSLPIQEIEVPAATCSIKEKDIWCVNEPSFRPDQIENSMIVISIPYINL